MLNKYPNFIDGLGVDATVSSTSSDYLFAYFTCENLYINLFVPSFSFNKNIFSDIFTGDTIEGTIKKQSRGKHIGKYMLINCKKVNFNKRFIDESLF